MSGNKAPSLSRKEEERLRTLFKEIHKFHLVIIVLLVEKIFYHIPMYYTSFVNY